MWNELYDLAIKNGIWAVLFMGLFIFVIKDTSKREQRYQQTIKDLTSHLGVVKSIKEDVDDIKNVVYNKANKKLNQKNIKIKKNTSKASCSQNDNTSKTGVSKKTEKCDNALQGLNNIEQTKDKEKVE